MESTLIQNLFSNFPQNSTLATLVWFCIWTYAPNSIQVRYVTLWLSFLEIPVHLVGVLEFQARVIWLLNQAIPRLDSGLIVAFLDKMFPPNAPFTERLLCFEGFSADRLPASAQVTFKNRVIKAAIEKFHQSSDWWSKSLSLRVLSAFATSEPEIFLSKVEQTQLSEIVVAASRMDQVRKDALAAEAWLALAVSCQRILVPHFIQELFEQFPALIKLQPLCKFGVLR